MSRAQPAPQAALSSLRSAPPAAAPPGCASRRVLGLRVDATSYDETAEAVAALARAGAGGAVCVATVHTVMEAFDDPDFRARVEAADRVTPDGVPLVWALRLLGVGGARRVYGPGLLPRVCARAEALGLRVGLYGGTPAVVGTLRARLRRRFPDLAIPYAHAPPFRPLRPEEDARVVGDLEATGVRILFVGLGCPKQERWMASHRSSLSCVMLGVGAAFDFHAGSKPQAPAFLQRVGLEWLFRLACEPRRLWRRYLHHNPRFVWHFARQLLRTGGLRTRQAGELP